MSKKGYTTVSGFINKHNQENRGCTGLAGTDHNQFIYHMKCNRCGNEYGANGSDIWQRKCPKCQSGKPGLVL